MPLADTQSKNIELGNNIKDRDFTVTNLGKDIKNLKEDHEKAINELTKGQEQLSQTQLKHNIEIQEYQSKYKSLLDEMEKKKTTPRVKKDTVKTVK